MLERFGPPNKFDHAPKDTELKVGNPDLPGNTFDIYRQTSDNESDPIWELVDTFTEESYEFYKNRIT